MPGIFGSTEAANSSLIVRIVHMWVLHIYYMHVFVGSACMGDWSLRVANCTYFRHVWWLHYTSLHACMHAHTSHMQVTCRSHAGHKHVTSCLAWPTLTTHPLHGKLRPLEVHNADGPIATLSNTPLYSLSGGEGLDGLRLKCSNFLYGDKHAEDYTIQRMM